MFCNLCESNPCTCAPMKSRDPRAELPPVQSYVPINEGQYMTKEEFGLNLYETIKTIGGIMGIDRQRAASIHKHEGFKVQGLNTRRHGLQQTLAKQLPLLTDDEMKQVLARYPWVVGA